jgi:hypothetical protein
MMKNHSFQRQITGHESITSYKTGEFSMYFFICSKNLLYIDVHKFSSKPFQLELVTTTYLPPLGHFLPWVWTKVYTLDDLPTSSWPSSYWTTPNSLRKLYVHATFPEVYDTKHMAYCSRRQLEASNSLDFAGSMSY